MWRRYSDSWGYDPSVRKPEFDEDEGYGKQERKAKKYEDTVSENSVEDNKSVDSETIAELPKPIEKVRETPTTSPTKKTIKKDNIKKIDLGAALHYGKDSNSSAQTPQKTTISNNHSNQLLLDDIFNSVAQQTNQTDANLLNNTNLNNNLFNNNNINVKSNSEEFADFSAFQSSATGTQSSLEDDFADFATALPTAMPTQPPAQSQNILPDVFSASSNPFIGGVSSTISPLSPMQSVSAPMVSPLDSFDILTPMPSSVVGSTSGSSIDLFGTSGTMPVTSADSGVPQNNTWSDLSKNVNISVDNLMGSKYEKQTAPSMNQLAKQVNHLSLGSVPQTNNSFGRGVSPISAQQPFAQQIPFGNGLNISQH